MPDSGAASSTRSGLIHRHALDEDNAAPDHRPDLQDCHRRWQSPPSLNRSTWSRWMSMKNTPGARSDRCSSISRPVALEQATMVGAVDPAPNATITLRASAPGRCRLAARCASARSPAARPAGPLAGRARRGRPAAGRDHRDGDEDRPEAPVGPRPHERRERQRLSPSPISAVVSGSAAAHEQRPEHAGPRNFAGARERPDSEHLRSTGRRRLDQQGRRIKAHSQPDRRQPAGDPCQ